ASAYGFTVPRASEPNRRISAISRCTAPKVAVTTRRSARTEALSRDRARTELYDRSGVRDGLLRLAQGVVVARRALRKAGRVSRREVVLVEPLGPVDQIRVRALRIRQGREECHEIVTPRVGAEGQVERLARLLGGLLRGEGGPFEMRLPGR